MIKRPGAQTKTCMLRFLGSIAHARESGRGYCSSDPHPSGTWRLLLAERRPRQTGPPLNIVPILRAHDGFVNTLRPRQNGRHFADDIFKCIFLNENAWILLKISLKFVPKVRINNIPALIQIMAWRRPGDKPLSEPMMDNLLTHVCVTRSQWVKNSQVVVHHRRSFSVSFLDSRMLENQLFCTNRYRFVTLSVSIHSLVQRMTAVASCCKSIKPPNQKIMGCN